MIDGIILLLFAPFITFNLSNLEVLECKLPSSLYYESLSKLKTNLLRSLVFDGKELSLSLEFNYLKSILI